MIRIYHNPRCRKSREGLALLENSGNSFEIVRYLDEPLDEEQLADLIKALGISADQLIRKNEAIWKSEYKGKSLSEKELLKAMVTHPKLIERPIIWKDGKAVIGRPAEKIHEIL
ncbi:arsenate reductase (glutaredoxin) [Zeaxanthinibacter enoshimensis]|uniref:Arsenate reductase n=1 Tax=Zeaxanthinibacter enoshimensis TaxID=392009 RepID=A0A4R6TPJ0_9FLAO|nr:arsenate reductase (glutaredoxin) [Zeaxanthinibacter enoshimensis]TDQ31545.1 arsenate reductase [Zeaxanthinibacter enoshimensis]